MACSFPQEFFSDHEGSRISRKQAFPVTLPLLSAQNSPQFETYQSIEALICNVSNCQFGSACRQIARRTFSQELV
jgi:hypothetical protein